MFIAFLLLEMRRRLSVSENEEEDVDETAATAEVKLLQQEEELKKYEKESSIAHVFTKDLEVLFS